MDLRERTAARYRFAIDLPLGRIAPGHYADPTCWWLDPHYLAESRHACCSNG